MPLPSTSRFIIIPKRLPGLCLPCRPPRVFRRVLSVSEGCGRLTVLHITPSVCRPRQICIQTYLTVCLHTADAAATCSCQTWCAVILSQPNLVLPVAPSLLKPSKCFLFSWFYGDSSACGDCLLCFYLILCSIPAYLSPTPYPLLSDYILPFPSSRVFSLAKAGHSSPKPRPSRSIMLGQESLPSLLRNAVR